MTTGRGQFQIDHVLIAVDDLTLASDVFRTRYGLTSLEGGEHPDWGTANRIVPLGDAYLELVTVVDPSQASLSSFGRWVRQADRFPRLLGWAARTINLDAIARRLDLTVAAGTRTRPDGQVLRWKLAGVEHAAADPSHPFFIEWAPAAPLPGHLPVEHAAGAVHIAALHLAGNLDRLNDWLGPHRLPLAVSPGTPAVTAVILGGPGGVDITLDAGSL